MGVTTIDECHRKNNGKGCLLATVGVYWTVDTTMYRSNVWLHHTIVVLECIGCLQLLYTARSKFV